MEQELPYLGSIDFMKDGLEYHYNNFIKLGKEIGLSESEIIQLDDDQMGLVYYMKHEAVAYLNRIGQFYYFATSRVVSSKLLPKSISDYLPSISELVKFRFKYAAHRAIDQPRSDDPDPFFLNQLDMEFTKHLTCFSDHRLVFTLFLSTESVLRFDLELQHPTIIAEIENLLQLLRNSDTTSKF